MTAPQDQPRFDSGRVARACAALSGGIHTTAPDREAAAVIEARFPGTGAQFRAARAFHARAAAWAVTEAGIRGVIVGAAGYPCPPDPHRAALAAVPDARFCFCDTDPEVALINLAVLGQDPRVTACEGDARDPAALLALPEAAALPRPLLLLLPLAAFCWDGLEASAVLAGYGRLLPSGSLLAVSLWVPDGGPAGEEFLGLWRELVGPVPGCSADDVAGWLEDAGTEIVPPGVRDVRGRPGMGWAEDAYRLRKPGRVVGAAARVQ